MDIDFEVIREGKVTQSEIEDLREAVGWDRAEGIYDKILKNIYTYYIVRIEKKLIGFLSVISDGVADSFLVDLMVHPKYQQRGIGYSVVKRAIQDLKSEGIRCIQVTFNPELESFYEKFGFHIFKAGIIDFKYMSIDDLK